MSRKCTLDTRTNRICGTIFVPEDDDVKNVQLSILKFMNSVDFVNDYYVILHDDTDNLHFHYIIISNSVKRLSTFLNTLQTILNIDVTCIGVERLINLNMYLRYFLHLDESEDKKRYLVTDIYSNKSVHELNYLLDSDTEELTAMQLILSVLTYPRSHDLMIHLGLARYHKYRYEIKELQDNYMMLQNQYGKLLDDSNNLPF